MTASNSAKFSERRRKGNNSSAEVIYDTIFHRSLIPSHKREFTQTDALASASKQQGESSLPVIYVGGDGGRKSQSGKVFDEIFSRVEMEKLKI
jgi:hypothetical protein